MMAMLLMMDVAWWVEDGGWKVEDRGQRVEDGGGFGQAAMGWTA